jgi:hypothetical protein
MRRLAHHIALNGDPRKVAFQSRDFIALRQALRILTMAFPRARSEIHLAD